MFLNVRRGIDGIEEEQTTFGKIYLVEDVEETFLGYTIEREWDNNKYGTAIPIGNYNLVPHNGSKYKNTFAMVNHDLDVGHLPMESKRSSCVIHSANLGSELLGCLAIGDKIGTVYGKTGILNSASTTQSVIDLIKSKQIEHLIISKGSA